LVVAACLLPQGFDCGGLDDSKKLTPAQREEMFDRVTRLARYHIEVVSVEDIDRKNILRATLEAMAWCLSQVGAARARVDGNQHPVDPPCPCELVVQGDGKFACIAAASVLAKVTRDRLMVEAATAYPGYGFETNMGYHAPEHIRGLELYGPTPIHRKSFDPVRSMLAQPCLGFDV